MQLAAQLVDPFLHIAQPDPVRAFTVIRINPAPVIFDPQCRSITMAAQINLYAAGLCVPFNICQRLLRDTIKRDFRVLIEAVSKHNSVKNRFNSSSCAKILTQ